MCCIFSTISKVYRIACCIICLAILVPAIIVGVYFYKWHNSSVDTGRWYVNDDDVVLKGRDVVSYFDGSDSVKGNEGFFTTYGEATWYFSSKANLDKFTNSTSSYKLAFGGYDAFAMASGKKKKSNPKDSEVYKLSITYAGFTFDEFRLFVFYDGKIKKLWSKGKDALILSALNKWCEEYPDSYDCKP